MVRTAAGVRAKPYVITENYPDDEAMAVVHHAARATGIDLQTFLFSFGAFLASGLVNVYRPFIDPAWRLFDLLENAELTIHTAVRINDRSADPPRLSVVRTGDDRVEIDYRSPRRLCALAKGIVQGLSDDYHEPVRITDLTCMHAGDPACRIEVVR